MRHTGWPASCARRRAIDYRTYSSGRAGGEAYELTCTTYLRLLAASGSHLKHWRESNARWTRGRNGYLVLREADCTLRDMLCVCADWLVIRSGQATRRQSGFERWCLR